jgi:hypothetical protein
VRKKKLVVVQDKYEWLHEVLGLYGIGALTTEQFWERMNVRRYGQSDIDSWLTEYLKRSEEDDRAGKEVEGRSA